MARTRQTTRLSAPSVEMVKPAPSYTSSIPASLRFPFLVLISLTSSSVLYSLASEFTAGDLSSVSKRLDDWWAIIGLLGWKAAQLALGWWGNYDAVDLGSLTFLSHMPHLYLLTTFYGIRPTTMASCLFIDVLTTYLPFRLLREESPTHSVEASKKGLVSNRSVINDLTVRIYTAFLAAGIYAVVVFGSFGTWLPVYLVTHFDGIRDISAAHSAALPFLIVSFVPTGYAAREFLFTAATGAKPDAYDKELARFNPTTATLSETIMYNLWGYSKRTRTLIIRTATVAIAGGLHTWLQTFVAIEGAEGFGAAGWSLVWAVGAALTGAAYWWVGDVEGISN